MDRVIYSDKMRCDNRTLPQHLTFDDQVNSSYVPHRSANRHHYCITTRSHSSLSHPTPTGLEDNQVSVHSSKPIENIAELACSFTRCTTIHGRLTTQLPDLLSRTKSGEEAEVVSGCRDDEKARWR